MAKTTAKNPADYVVQLNMNGLRGRMLRLPANRANREILLVYGHHASLERLFGLAELLNDYGAVTMPDLPGFGGMQSFYNLGITPSVDNLADYLATFIKFRYKRRRLTIVGLSFGFAVVTRMLQKYPDIAARTDLAVSLAGFSHHSDFRLKKRYSFMFRYGSVFFGWLPVAWFVQTVLFRPRLLRLSYKLTASSNEKLNGAKKQELADRIEFEIKLWRQNDVRTYMKTTSEMFRLDLCKQQLKVPACHVTVKHDRYFDNNTVEQHLRVIFSDLIVLDSNMPNHSQTIIASAKDAAGFMPARLKAMLRTN